jgi:hypothetical protein
MSFEPHKPARLVSLLTSGEVLTLDPAWDESQCEAVVEVCHLRAREERGILMEEEARVWIRIKEKQSNYQPKTPSLQRALKRYRAEQCSSDVRKAVEGLRARDGTEEGS